MKCSECGKEFNTEEKGYILTEQWKKGDEVRYFCSRSCLHYYLDPYDY